MMKSLCAGSFMLMLIGCGGQEFSEESSFESKASALSFVNSRVWGSHNCSITTNVQNDRVLGFWVAWNPGPIAYHEPGYSGFVSGTDCYGSTTLPIRTVCGEKGDPTPCYVDLSLLGCSTKKSAYVYTTIQCDPPNVNLLTAIRTLLPGQAIWNSTEMAILL